MKILGMEEESSEPVYYVRLIDGSELLSYVISPAEMQTILDEGVDDGFLDADDDEFVDSQITLVYPVQIKTRINKDETGEESYFTPFLSFTANGISSISFDFVMILDEADETIISDYQQMVNDYYLSKVSRIEESDKPKRKSKPKKG